MGLDMYLTKAKRIENVTPSQLKVVDNYFNYLKRPEQYKDCTMKEWCGISKKEVDFKLAEKYIKEFTHKYSMWDTEQKYGYETIFTSLIDWRKSNQIHKWFVDNIQDGNDNCEIYEVTKEKLFLLLATCQEVLGSCKLVSGQIKNGYTFKDGQEVPNWINGKYIEDISVAEKLLPTKSGFFFGCTDYDEYYYEDIVFTIEKLKKVLDETDFEHEIVMYQSSW